MESLNTSSNIRYHSLLKVIFRLAGLYNLIAGVFGTIIAFIEVFASNDYLNGYSKGYLLLHGGDFIFALIQGLFGIIVIFLSNFLAGQAVGQHKEMTLHEEELPLIVAIVLKLVIIFAYGFLMLMLLLEIAEMVLSDHSELPDYWMALIYVIPAGLLYLVQKNAGRLARIISK